MPAATIMRLAQHSRTFLIAFVLLSPSCVPQRNNLRIEGGRVPTFAASGEGIVDGIRVSGPDFKWEIMPAGEIDLRELEKREPITYGKVPEGFRQVSPKDNMPPPKLFEGGTFNATLWVRDRGGANINFTIHNGKVLAEGY